MYKKINQNLNKYVDLILKVGLNLQKGQRLLIGFVNPINSGTPLELRKFTQLVTKEAYELGAKFVEVLWNDPQLELIRYEHAPKDSFSEVSLWRKEVTLEYLKNGDAILAFAAQDPDLLINQNSQHIMESTQATYNLYHEVSDLIRKNQSNWVITTAPVEGWAKKVFQDLDSNESIKKLWDLIFEICRIKKIDPISIWQNHIKTLKTRCKYLNDKKYNRLILKAPGTDLKIGLPNKYLFGGGSAITQNGIEFVPNLPTEEIFTLPDKFKTEGVVKSTKPFYYRGVYIENFSFKFSNGKVVEIKTETGKDFLKNIMELDEGAKYLGEIGLVPNDSPVSKTGLLFYNGLIDENASVHLALGGAYKNCLENGQKMSDEEFIKAGGNKSMIHLDFMIGSDKLNIDGITEDGKIESIMKNGKWSFQLPNN